MKEHGKEPGTKFMISSESRDPNRKFLPASREEMVARGWDQVDVVLVTGDAYVDHPSFGVALIGRWLEAHGFRVAILAQPRHDNAADFTRFGRPRLFFGITGGNLDSIVANYSGNAKVRDMDQYSPAGNPYFGEVAERRERRRPDRATIRFAQLARSAYPGVLLVLGGLEASLRRFVHYDFQQARLRGSILTDAKADLLVYGMGERAILEIADRCSKGEPLSGIPGTCERLKGNEGNISSSAPHLGEDGVLIIPGWHEIQADRSKFMEGELAVDRHARSLSHRPILQRQQSMWIRQNRPAAPLETNELDRLYELPYARAPHPASGDVPAFRMIRDSITIVRGCSGNCSFCAITRHQGPVIVNRSQRSILEEIRRVAADPGFGGTISDLGGPTANLYGTSCARKQCRRHDCFYPDLCPHLRVDEEAFLNLLQEAGKIERVKHLFVSSGLRMELLLQTPRLLTQLLKRHTAGAIKIAPEHTEKEVLRLMHKADDNLLPRFLDTCRRLAREHGLKISINPYFITAHPGCTAPHMELLARKLDKMGLKVRQFQDFTPTPGTLSTAMYLTGLDRDTGKPLQVPRGAAERRSQRLVLEKMSGRSGNRPSGRRTKK